MIPPNGISIAAGRITLSGTAAPHQTVEVFDWLMPVAGTEADDSGHWTMNLVSIAEGDHLFTITAIDAAGKTVPGERSCTVTVEGSSPAVDADRESVSKRSTSRQGWLARRLGLFQRKHAEPGVREEAVRDQPEEKIFDAPDTTPEVACTVPRPPASIPMPAAPLPQRPPDTPADRPPSEPEPSLQDQRRGDLDTTLYPAEEELVIEAAPVVEDSRRTDAVMLDMQEVTSEELETDEFS